MTAGSHQRLDISAGLASVVVASVLVALKLWALAATGALSVAASLIDSGFDLMVSLAGLAAIVYSARPPDEDHSFGHTSVEDLAALGQSLFITASACVIGWVAVGRLLGAEPVVLAGEGRGIVVMLASLLVTLALITWQRRVVRRTGSRVVAADSLHYLGDLIPNLGAILSLAAAGWLGLHRIDSVVALGAALWLLSGAARIGKAAWDALMDRRADPDLIAGIATLARGWPGVYGFHDLKTRMAGRRVFVVIHIELDGAQTLTQAHGIGAGLRRAIMQKYPRADVVIHQDVARDTAPAPSTPHPPGAR